jgi:tetratricopeptide (TPR) repeat protein
MSSNLIFSVFSANLYKKILFYFISILLVLVIYSCNITDKKDKDLISVDTTLSKLNSPELKNINLKLLNDPNNPDLYYERAGVYFKNHDLEAAKNDALRAIKIDSLKVNYFVLLSDIYFTANETRFAKENLERCIKINPNSTDANLKLAELFFYVKKYQEAINYSNSALKINDNTAKAYFIKAMCYKESGDTSNAISSFQTTIEQDNDLIDAYLELGIIFTRKKNPLAIEYLKSALNIEPANEDILYNMAYYYQITSNYTIAGDLYKKIISKNIKYKEAHYNLGSIEILKNKNYSDAIKHFSNAINADANYDDAYFARGVCYEELKDKTNAIADYQMTLQINPKNNFAIENLNNLEK